MKDFYDLYTILERDLYDPLVLKVAVTATFANRNTHYEENNQFFSPEFGNDEGLKMRWQAFMKKLNSPVKLSLREVVACIQCRLGDCWENLKYQK